MTGINVGKLSIESGLQARDWSEAFLFLQFALSLVFVVAV